MRSFNAGILMILLLALTACSTHKPMPAVKYVDLDRFMGDWFVIANIPTFLEKDSYNPVETYSLIMTAPLPLHLPLTREV